MNLMNTNDNTLMTILAPIANYISDNQYDKANEGLILWKDPGHFVKIWDNM